jgi:hypothetical protein
MTQEAVIRDRSETCDKNKDGAAAPRTLFSELNGPGSQDCARAILRRACPGLFSCAPYGSFLSVTRDDAFGEHRLDSAEGLAGAFFVLDQGERGRAKRTWLSP